MHTSYEFAEAFDLEHRSVVALIEQYIEYLEVTKKQKSTRGRALTYYAFGDLTSKKLITLLQNNKKTVPAKFALFAE